MTIATHITLLYHASLTRMKMRMILKVVAFVDMVVHMVLFVESEASYVACSCHAAKVSSATSGPVSLPSGRNVVISMKSAAT